MTSRLRLYSAPILALLLIAAFSAGCSQQQQKPSEAIGTDKPSSETSRSAATQPAASPANRADLGSQPNINGNQVMQCVKEVVAFGPRPPGSAGHEKLEQYIVSKLKGVDVEQDKFTAQTPAGQFPINNIIAKFSGKKDGIIVVAGHYDTNYPLPKTYVGANDGGSTTALLLALADHFRGKQLDGYSVWLVWTDGEEAFVKWTDTDSLYGTRQLAHQWQQDGTAKKVRAFILVDMIGDDDLDIQRDTNSTPWLTDVVSQAATDLGYQSHFFQQTIAIEDDHIPFAKIGVPVVDLIDFDYGYNNVFHHTPEDTIDKLSPQSLAITGDVVLRTIQLLNAR
ncbi:MAG: M28 family peptidase [Candidatus Korobacteraceae bacterium]|jgi:Zn-dependent M28 family amino/carboxypeptidase